MLKLKASQMLESWWRHPFVRRLALVQLLLCLLMLGLAVLSLYQSRLKYEEGAEVTTQNLAQLMQHETSTSVRMIDLLLQDIAHEYLEHRYSEAALNALIELHRQRHAELDGIRIVDAQGWLTHGTGVLPKHKVNIGDRPHFKRLEHEPELGLLITKPFILRINGIGALVLGRAIRQPDGQFVGAVLATVPLSYFVGKFPSLQIGPHGSMIVFDDDFDLVVRVPARPGTDSPVGQKILAPELMALVRTRQTTGTFRFRLSFDQLERVGAYRKIPDTPLNVAIALASDDYLVAWYKEVQKTGALVVALWLASFVMSLYIFRARQRKTAAVTALRDANRTLDAEKHLNQAIIQSSPMAIFSRDRQGRVTSWNPAAEKLFGWSATEIMGRALMDISAEVRADYEKNINLVLSGQSIIEKEVQRGNRTGQMIDMSLTLTPLRGPDGHIDGYLGLAADISQRKAAEAQIEFLAYRDALTHLPNRLLLQDRFAQAIAYADRAGTRVALLFLDLDNFKTINDSLGHTVGDALLMEVARRLQACVRDTDTISRQGGDEFLILLANQHSAESISPVLPKILECLTTVFEFERHELTTSASIGVALYPDDGKDFATLLKKSDTAMYQAKEAGRNNYRYFDEQMNVEAVDHLALKTGLRKALVREEFVLHYQPQIDLATETVLGAEALIRWDHPEQGLLAPGRFVKLAEDSGLIVPIGAWVLEEACRQAVAWQAAGLPKLVMAVNLSAVQFKRGDVVQAVTQALAASGLEPHLLELELTESILIQDSEGMLTKVRRLKQLGVKLSIDDFGTGYSSLSYLKRFNVDKLKIDQSFVRDLMTDEDDATIVRAIIQMAHSLRLKTVAEGVETAALLERLYRMECDEAQGYHIARPMNAAAFASYLESKQQPPV